MSFFSRNRPPGRSLYPRWIIWGAVIYVLLGLLFQQKSGIPVGETLFPAVDLQKQKALLLPEDPKKKPSTPEEKNEPDSPPPR